MTRGFIQGFADAGCSIETGSRAKAKQKTCKRCDAGIENRKTYCGPCSNIRLQETIAANRLKYNRAKQDAGAA